jgi:nucleoside-diphosphate-sugar epimerase
MQYNDDVAKIFIRAARTSFQGAAVFNLRGALVDTPQVIAAIETAAPAARGSITFDPTPLPIPEAFDDTPLRHLLGALPETPFQAGVSATITFFKQKLLDGSIQFES